MELTSVIRRALAKTSGLPDDRRAEVIAQYIEVAMDLDNERPNPDAGSREVVSRPLADSVQPAVTPPLPTGVRMVAVPGDAEFELPQRMNTGVVGKMEPKARFYGVDYIQEFVESELPKTITVELEDGTPVKLIRAIKTDRMDDRFCQPETKGQEGAVSVMYSQQGEADAPRVVFSSGALLPVLSAAVEEIKSAAKARYSATERTPVKPRPAKVVRLDLSETLANSVGGDADEAHDGQEALSRMGSRPRGWNQ